MAFGTVTRSILIVAVMALAACDTAEERAEEHFEAAVALLDDGDVERAIVEFRNVFQLNPDHIEARQAFGQLMLNEGNTSAAYTNFLRVVEQQPDNIHSRLQLAEMAILRQNWEEARRHGEVVIQAQADTVESRILNMALNFERAASEEDEPRLRELTREAEGLYVEDPESEILMRILVEGYSREQEPDKALTVIDDYLERQPLDPRMNTLKLQILSRQDKTEEAEAHLRVMIERFPENERLKEALLRIMVASGRPDDAEAYLRELAAEATDEARSDRILAIVTFIRQRDGVEAAIAELDTVIAENEDNSVFKALKDSLLFDDGQRDEGIALMQEALDGQEPNDQTNRLRVSLAKMLEATGNETGARAMVGEVIEADSSNTEALKMQARWIIAEDRAEEAVAMLRRVLDQDPDDSEAMMLMSDAHARNGNSELARDLLSLAVEASENGRVESLRFAQALLADESYRPAEDVLVQALRQTPGDFALLDLLAQVYLGMEDYSRATGVEEAIRRIDTPRARRAADGLRVAILARREGRDQATAFLEDLAGGDNASLTARVNLLRARLNGGDTEGALNLANDILAENPDNPVLKLIVANTQLSLQNYPEAEAILRDVIDNHDGNDRIWIQLLRVIGAQGKTEEVAALTDEGLERFPNSARLKWAHASRLELLGDIDGAIAVYEDLYAQNSNTIIVANNLASLLATYRDDQESLDRAWTVARRLRGSEVAPFQDTYGWIAFRRGDLEEALRHLEPAARTLSSDPIVQFHYATALEAAERPSEALEQFRRVLEVAEDDDERTQIADARAAIERLEAAGVE